MWRTLARNAFSLGAARALSAALAIALVVYLARVRGAQALGEFSLLFAVFLLTQQLPLLGLHLLVIREAGAGSQRLASLVANAAPLGLAAAALMAVVVGVGGGWAYPGLQPAFWLVGLALLPAAIAALVENVLVGQQRIPTLARIAVAENAGRTASSLVALALGGGLTEVFAIFLAARLLATAAYLRHEDLRGLFRAPVEAKALRELARQVPVFFGILATGLLMTRVDVLVLAHLDSVEEVGRYAAPYRIYEAALMVPSMATVVLYPVLSRLFSSAPGQFPHAVALLLRSGLVLGAPVALALAFASRDVMTLAFGAQYALMHTVLQVFAGAVLLVWTNQMLASALLAARRQSADLLATTAACAVYLPLLAWLASRHGAMGAAIASAATSATQVALRLWLLRGAAVPGKFGELGKFALASLAAVAISFGLAPALGYGALALGLLAYAIGIGVSRAYTRADVRGIGQALALRTAA